MMGILMMFLNIRLRMRRMIFKIICKMQVDDDDDDDENENSDD